MSWKEIRNEYNKQYPLATYLCDVYDKLSNEVVDILQEFESISESTRWVNELICLRHRDMWKVEDCVNEIIRDKKIREYREKRFLNTIANLPNKEYLNWRR